MGVLATKVPEADYPMNDVLQAVQWVYSMDFKTDKGLRAECCENATSTLAKIVYFISNSAALSADIVNQGMLAKLPLTTDTEEAQATHREFLKQIIG